MQVKRYGLTALMLGALLLAGKFSWAGDVTVPAGDFGDPSYIGVTVHKMWVSTTATCADPILVPGVGSNTEIDFWSNNNTIGAPTLPNGTYNCVIIKINDVVNAKPVFNSNSGACLTSTTYPMDIFKADDGTTQCPGEAQVAGDGAMGTPSNPPQQPCLYISIVGLSWTAPPLPSVEKMAHAFVVSGDRSAIFRMNFQGKIIDMTTAGPHVCWMNAPDIGFEAP